MDIVPFEPRHAAAFRALNEAWITTLFALEPKDIEVLGDPQTHIIAKGGQIFMAEEAGACVGCCALIAMPDGGLELAKMTVTESQRGAGLGRRLMEAAIAHAEAKKATRLYLETNSALAPALALYRAYGFEDLPDERRPNTDYARADVFMERWF